MSRPPTSSKFIRGDTNDDRVVMTSTLGWAEDAVAKMYMQQLLRRVRYILTTHNWRVFHLQEFYPRSARLYGLNVNKGQEVKVRFRLPGNKNAFFPFQEIMCTLLHEVVHCEFSRHDKKFWDCYRVVVLECEELDVRFAASENPSIGRNFPSLRNHEIDAQLDRAAVTAAAQDRLNKNGELTTELDLSIPDAFHGYHVFRPGAGASQKASGQVASPNRNGDGVKTVIHLQVPRFMSTRRLCDDGLTSDTTTTTSSGLPNAPPANALLRSILGNRAQNPNGPGVPVGSSTPEKVKRRRTMGKGHVLSGASMYQRRKNIKQQQVLAEEQSPEQATERRRVLAAQAVARRLDSITLAGIQMLSTYSGDSNTESNGSEASESTVPAAETRSSLESGRTRKTLLEYFNENVERHSHCLDSCDGDDVIVEEDRSCTSELPHEETHDDGRKDEWRTTDEPQPLPAKDETELLLADEIGSAKTETAVSKRNRTELESGYKYAHSGQRVCQRCTFCNDDDSPACKMCLCPLNDSTVHAKAGETISNPIDVDDDDF